MELLPETAAGSPRVVLVVEDEVLIRWVVADRLREAGLHVVEAGTAEEALSFLGVDQQVDLVFTDVRMPGAMDGLELARELKRNYPSIPVVITSGHLVPQETGDLGLFIPKPYDTEIALVLISRILGLEPSAI